MRIVDVGTGSGAIAIALAHHLPQAQLIALDLSSEALGVAASNAVLNNVAERVRCLESDLLSAVAREPAFDAIVCNPPYIPSVDRDYAASAGATLSLRSRCTAVPRGSTSTAV